jgi:MYXO-CTERM domain-containing protein
VASDGAASDYFGASVSLSDNNALVGAYYGKVNGISTGSAYYYQALNSIEETDPPKKEIVKLMASDGAAGDNFGASVSLSGNLFVIGARYAAPNGKMYAGKSYAGDIRAFTTLDQGNVTLSTAGLSFVSQSDWVIGDKTSGNKVTLSKVWSSNSIPLHEAWFPDTANVTATDKGVHIGKNTDADSNMLVIQGKLTAGKIEIGSATTTGNNLQIEGTGRVDASVDASGATGTVTIHARNFITFVLGADSESDTTGAINPLFKMGELAIAQGTGIAKIRVELADDYEPAENTAFNLIDLTGGVSVLPNASTLALELPASQQWDTSRFESDGVIFACGASPTSTGAGGTPEPSTYALWGGALLAGLIFLHRRRKQK